MITPKQARFVAEYLIDLNGKQAAIRAGYSPKSAEVQASQLLSNPKVAVVVQEAKAKQLEALGVTAQRVLQEMTSLALVDARGFWNADGTLKNISDLTAEQGAALAGFEAIIKNATAGDKKQDLVHKIKFWDKPRSLEMLAKHFGLLTDKVEHSGSIEISWKSPNP